MKKIHIRNKQELHETIIKRGYSLSIMSKKIGKSRQYLSKSLERGIIGAMPAKALSEELGIEYDELFEIM